MIDLTKLEFAIDKFWSQVRKADGNSCWNWCGAVDTRGYGMIGHPSLNTTIRAHRLAYLFANGNPGDLFVCHHCDNRLCCNPAHLFLGTQAQNMADMRDKDRRKGIGCMESNGRAKLTLDQIIEIRAGKLGQRATAKIYGVSKAQIQRIRSGKQWVLE